jgi:DNA-binding transcriptional regulator YdaS (Cro superfamily)
MALPNYTLEQRREMALKLGIEEQYLYQILRGIAKPAAALARRFNTLEPSATLQDLRPDDWQIIWPELAKRTLKATAKA